MVLQRDVPYFFNTKIGVFLNTLPSSSTDFGSSNTALKMYNGAYVASNSSSYGSYYNARVANALAASEAVSAKDYVLNICPHNWTLPTYLQQNSVAGYVNDFRVAFAGHFYNSSSLLYSGTYGYWWPRTASGSTSFYRMIIYSGSLSVNSGYDIRYGFSVRCLVK